MKKFFLVFAVLAASGCASIVSGTDQSVTVMTEPPGAACKLERGGAVVSYVNPTPGTARLGKSKENVSVICEKEGHETAASALASEFQGMTFGNLIFGGIIGVAVDASTGAMNKYPDSVNILLPPTSFPSTVERDDFYDRAKERVTAEATAAIATAKKNCLPDAATQCEVVAKAIETERDARIADLEAKRQRARTL